MLNKYFTLIFLMLISIGCSTQIYNFNKKSLFVDTNGKEFFIIKKQAGNQCFIKYADRYIVKGNLKQISKNVFTTYSEIIESNLVDSLLRDAPLDKVLELKVKKSLLTDSIIFYSKNTFKYNNKIFQKK